MGPLCVDSERCAVDPTKGPVLLSLRVRFGNSKDRIAIRGIGLHLS
jgi:hypothetical protein